MRVKRTQVSQDTSNNRQDPRHHVSFIPKPVKSPSPDQKSSNIITSTKSPEMSDIKRKLTPTHRDYTFSYQQLYQNRERQIRANLTPAQCKHISHSYQSANQKQNLQYIKTTANNAKRSEVDEFKFATPPSNPRARNMKIQILPDYKASDFQVGNRTSQRRRQEFRLNDYDYDQALRERDQTIRQLRQIIDMINKSNRGGEQADEGRDFDVFNRIKQQKQSKTALLIENQKLLHIIQNNQIKVTPSRQNVLHRQISELKQSLRDRELQIEQVVSSSNKKLEHYRMENSELQNQNERLIKFIRDSQERSKSESLANSALSQQNRSMDKEKYALSKIKEQHQENIQSIKDNFYRDFQQLQIAFQSHTQQIQSRLQIMNSKLTYLQGLKYRLQDIPYNKNRKGLSLQQSHRQKERHQQIESLLLQKYSKYEQQISDLKRINQQLNQQLSRAAEQTRKLQDQVRISSSQLQLRYKQSQNQQAMVLVQKLIKQKSQLQNLVQSVQKQNNNLKYEVQRRQRFRDQQINQVQNKITSQYIKQMEQERQSYNQIIKQANQKARKLQDQLIRATEEYKKDKIDTERKVKQAIQLFTKQNQLFREQNIKLKGQISASKSQNNKNNNQLIQQYENLKNRFTKLEKDMAELNRQKQQIYQQNIQLKAQINQRHRIISELRQQILQLKEHVDHQNSFNDQLQVRHQQLQKQLADDKHQFMRQITCMEQQIQKKNQQLDLAAEKIRVNQQNTKKKGEEVQRFYQLYEELKRQRVSFKYETLEKELEELKALISSFEINKKTMLEGDLIEDYYRLNFQYQNKIEESVKQSKQIERLKDQLVSQQRQKLLFQQKVSLLQKNIEIYQRQMRQRKALYEQLLQEKLRIQKQASMNKKIKAQKSIIQEGYNSKIAQINLRINRILSLERDRTQKWHNYQNSHRILE